MHFLSSTLIKISLILFAASQIAIAGPVPDVRNDISGKGGKGGKVEKPHDHNNDVGGYSLAGMHHKQGDTVGESAGPFSAEPGSAQGGSVSGEGGGLLNILSGNGGPGGTSGGTNILDILRRNL